MFAIRDEPYWANGIVFVRHTARYLRFKVTIQFCKTFKFSGGAGG